MRKEFSEILFKKMSDDNKIVIITGDLGYGLWDKIRINYPDRFYNVGSSEQLMLGMACGMAMEGKLPFVYSITPFAIYRPFEFIRNYVDHEKLPVKIIGGGRDKDYGYLGFSHWAEEDKLVMSVFQNITTLHPETNKELLEKSDIIFDKRTPVYLNLRK